MTKFAFRLHRVLDFRRLRATLARNALDQIEADRQRLFAHERAIHASRQQEELAIREPGVSLGATRLDALDQMQAYTAIARQRFAQEHIELDRRMQAQRRAVLEAERQVGLLEKLEARQRAGWQVRFDQELDELAADSYLSRFHRESTQGSR
ncbi:MAG: hypothetical protein K2X03_13540 [Bryobacteraceae bacterium]|nr:hypothetical protein [Bryobacteraceae bacterium]